MNDPDLINRILNSTDLPREEYGVRFQIVRNGDGVEVHMILSDYTKSQDVHKAVKRAMQWREHCRQYAETRPFESIDGMLKYWVYEVDSKKTTNAEIASLQSASTIHAIEEFNRKNHQGTYDPEPLKEAIALLDFWGYDGDSVAYLLTIALRRLERGESPFAEPPVTSERVRNKLNNFRRRKTNRAIPLNSYTVSTS